MSSVDPAATTVGERADRVRAALASDPSNREVLAELLPAHVARIGADSVFAFTDWQQFDQWPQSY
jgi:hypothetical protein